MERAKPARPRPRRNNAPIRRQKPATSVPDFMFALAATGWMMAAIFLIASFADSNVTAGQAGVTLARLFSGALAACALFAFLIGLMLLRGERGTADHYVTPFILGAIIGVLEALIFLWPEERLLAAPFVLLVLVFRPVRRMLARLFRPARGYAR